MPDLYKITNEKIRSDDLYDIVVSNSDGAVVSFAGVVRDNTGGRATSYLEYDVYEEMAEKEMRSIGDKIRTRWDVNAIAILHGQGRMEIGDISVLIAISSPNRRAALESCHFAIDRLKETVPIWKKEVWTDGEAWIEGDPSARAPESKTE